MDGRRTDVMLFENPIALRKKSSVVETDEEKNETLVTVRVR